MVLGEIKYSGKAFIAGEACNITTVAIVATGYGIDITPYDTGSQAYAMKGYTVGNYAPHSAGFGNHDFLESLLDYYGIKNSGFTAKDKERIKSHLKSGKPIIANVGDNKWILFDTSGHYVTLLDYNELDDTVFVGDPAGVTSCWVKLDDALVGIRSSGVNYIDD